MVNLQSRTGATTAPGGVRITLSAIALASALFLSGCGSSAAPGGNVSITVDPALLAGLTGQIPGQLPQIPGQIPGQLPQIPGQIPGQLPQLPPAIGPGALTGESIPQLNDGPKVAQLPPFAPGSTDPNAQGGLPPLPPLAPGIDPNAATAAAPVPGTSPASPGTTPIDPATLAAAPTAPQSTPPQTGGQNAPNPLSTTAQAISDQHGVRLAGYPDAQGLVNLNTALSLYPAGAARGATINFTGQNAGSLGGTWQTGGLVTLYQTGVHVCAHELAHHIVEQNRAQWGAQLKQLLRLDGSDFPQSAYAQKNAQLGNFEEVAAETVSYYAEGRWKPANPQLEALLKAMITNQPGATA